MAILAGIQVRIIYTHKVLYGTFAMERRPAYIGDFEWEGRRAALPTRESIIADLTNLCLSSPPSYAQCIAPRMWGRRSACAEFVSRLITENKSVTVGLYNFSEEAHSKFVVRVCTGAPTTSEECIRSRLVRVTQDTEVNDIPFLVIIDEVQFAPRHPALFTTRVYGITTPCEHPRDILAESAADYTGDEAFCVLFDRALNKFADESAGSDISGV